MMNRTVKFTLLKYIQVCILALSSAAQAQNIEYEFTNFTMGNSGALSFTTNNFTAAGVDKQNVYWVGSQNGGLYYLNDQEVKVWFKSSVLTDVFINDIKTDPDGGVWIAQSGRAAQSGNSNIAGGLNYLPNGSEAQMIFYTVQGTVNNGNLWSRNVRSVYVNPNSGTQAGGLPQVWAAQGTFISSFNTQRGGLNFGLRPEPPLFIRNIQGLPLFNSNLSANTPIVESVGGNDKEVWAGSRLNQGRSALIRYKLNGDSIKVYDHNNTSVLPLGFFPNAIHVDAAGNSWIGLREGGLRMHSAQGDWFTMNDPSLFPSGTQINHNAITSDNTGNVYIGTSRGLLIFWSPDFFGSTFTNPGDYTLLTTQQGLVHDNVRGMAFDPKNGQLLIATAGGVSLLKIKPEHILGTVFNVGTGLTNTERSAGGFVKNKPPRGFKATLFDSQTGQTVETLNLQNVSRYEFTQANDQDTYDVEIEYNWTDGRRLSYRIDNVRNKNFVPPVLVPEAVLEEKTDLSKVLMDQKLEVPLSFGIKGLNIPAGGYNLSNYNLASSRYTGVGVFPDRDLEQLNNLANYITVLFATDKMGKQAASIEAEGFALVLDLIQFIIEEVKVAKIPTDFTLTDDDPLDAAGIKVEAIKAAANSLKLIQERGIAELKKWMAKYPAEPEMKKVIELGITMLNDALGTTIGLLEDGRGKTALNTLLAQLKKIMATVAAQGMHKVLYLQGRHKDVVPKTSQESFDKVSPKSFELVYDAVASPSTESLVANADKTINENKELIAAAAQVAEISGATSGLADAASKLALIPGGQVAGGLFKALAIGAKVVKGGALLAGSIVGWQAASDIRTQSSLIRGRAGFEAEPGAGDDATTAIALMEMKTLGHGTLSSVDSISARATRLNNRLLALNTQHYQPATWQPAAYGAQFKAWRMDDSLLTAALSDGLLQLQPYLDSAFARLPGFEQEFTATLSNVLETKVQLNREFLYRNLAWMYLSDKNAEKQGMDSLVNNLRAIHDSLIARMQQLTLQIQSDPTLLADAYLERTRFLYQHSLVPGSTGAARVTFKNVGPVPMQQLRFLMDPLTAGFTLTSPDSIFRGTLAPGDTVQVVLLFTSPMVDSIGRFRIVPVAANGRTPEVTGSLFVVNPNKVFSVREGNWNDPGTWSTGSVPTPANDIQIGHKVTVNVNVTCRTMYVAINGDLVVQDGRSVTVQQ